MKKVFLNGCMVVLLLFCIAMTGCASQDSIVGTWHSVDGEGTLAFYKDGTCISSRMDETAEYKQQEDGTLIITWGIFGNEIIAKRTDDID